MSNLELVLLILAGVFGFIQLCLLLLMILHNVRVSVLWSIPAVGFFIAWLFVR